MVVTNAPTGALATHISSAGVQLEPLTISGLTPTSVTSNGANYAVVGYDAGLNTIATLFSPTTIAVKNLLIRSPDTSKVGDPIITSDGREFLITWLTRGGCQAPCPVNLQFMRLDNTLGRIDPNVLSIAVESASDLDAAWNGHHYGVAVINTGQIRLYRIPTRGEALPPVMAQDGSSNAARDVSIRPLGERFGIAWREPSTETNRGSVINIDGTVAFWLQLDQGPGSTTGPVLLMAPGGLIASVASITNDDAPHHGAERVLMRIDAPTGAPSAPRLQVNVVGDAVKFEWTLPAGLVNGYRVEYKIGDGSWNELEGWLPSTERGGSLVGLPRNNAYTFRVRAWGDAGTGPYSNEGLVVIGGKLRAVR
jgi:hypothetical protein